MDTAKALSTELKGVQKAGKEVLEGKQKLIDAQNQEIDRLRQETALQKQRITELMAEGTSVTTDLDQARLKLE